MRTLTSAAFGVEMLRLGVWLVLLIAIFVPMERFRALHPRSLPIAFERKCRLAGGSKGVLRRVRRAVPVRLF